jgi:periplasmic divalent cation tolerance protein
MQVTTAAESEAAAASLAEEAVRRRLAASAQISGPVKSAYWHLGEFGTGVEWLAVMLTTEQRYADLEAFLRANHPWKNPQITAVEIAAGSAQCVRWAHQAASPEPLGSPHRDPE